jgi:hypothetical protein
MKKARILSNRIRILLLGICLPILTSCSLPADEPVRVVKDYIHALAAQDQIAITNLTCKDWETQAFLELDALQLVKATVSDLSCQVTEAVAGGEVVECTGRIDTSYNNEVSTTDLSRNRYFVSHENGDWLVCGYR